MVKKILLLLIISIVFLFNSNKVFADEVSPGGICKQGVSICKDDSKGNHYTCQSSGFKDLDGKDVYQCGLSPVGNTFGTIQPPDALKGFLKADPTGTGAISNFLSNLVALMFSLAGIVFIFMLLWGAFDWLMSGGDKEKISSAQKKIINAIIGLILFAIAFAVINMLGIFTGFTFFKQT